MVGFCWVLVKPLGPIHKYVPPLGEADRLIVCPAQAGLGAMVAVTVCTGFTVMVYDDGIPTHPFTVGVTEIVAVMGDEPELAAVKAGRLPLPEGAVKPIAGFELVQTKEANNGSEEKV